MNKIRRALVPGSFDPPTIGHYDLALRAAEIGAEALLLAKNTDYIYTADPRKDPDAKPIEEIGYVEVIDRGLTVMDNSALTLCMDNHIPILVFGLKGEKNIMRVACGEKIGTIVR